MNATSTKQVDPLGTSDEIGKSGTTRMTSKQDSLERAAAGIPAAAVTVALLRIVTDMVTDWDIEGGAALATGTRLVADLGFVSVDLIHLIVAIEEHFGHRRLDFQELLMREGRYVDELTVGEVATFVTAKLAGGQK